MKFRLLSKWLTSGYSLQGKQHISREWIKEYHRNPACVVMVCNVKRYSENIFDIIIWMATHQVEATDFKKIRDTVVECIINKMEKDFITKYDHKLRE